MGKCKVEFNVKANVEAKEIFVVGNVKELGAWNETKAIKLTFDESKCLFTTSKMIEVGTNVEYKIMLTASWEHVEKGEWNSEIENHKFVAQKGHKEEVEVRYFQ